MRHLRVAAAILLMLALASCQRKSKSKAEDDAGQPYKPRTKVISLQKPATLFEDNFPLPTFDKLELLQPGKKPHRALRYHFGELRDHTFTVDARVVRREIIDSNLVDPLTLPTIRYGLGFSSAVIDEDGTATLYVRGLRATILDSKTPIAEEAATLAERQVEVFRDNLERQRGSAKLSDRGILGEVEITTTGKDSENVERTKQELQQLLLESVVPFPKEAVGVGAKWRAKLRLRRGAHSVSQVATYELLAVDKGRVRLKAHLKQVGEPQMVHPRYLPKGVSAELKVLLWQTEGELEVDLGVPTPVKGELTVALKTHGTIRTNKRTRDVYAESDGSLTFATTTP